MNEKKIIFLDIDGVVLPNRANFLPTQTEPVYTTFDPCSVSLLNCVALARGWTIVIHSSWLLYFKGDTLKHCIEQGIHEHLFHSTEPMCSSKIHCRYDRIDDWLSRHEEVVKYVILDDVPPEEGYPRSQNVILTDEDEGITMEVYRKLAKL